VLVAATRQPIYHAHIINRGRNIRRLLGQAAS
jgi:hypothetical protein